MAEGPGTSFGKPIAPRERAAVIAVHGVGDQPAGATDVPPEKDGR
jgi:hypothetical protein